MFSFQGANLIRAANELNNSLCSPLGLAIPFREPVVVWVSRFPARSFPVFLQALRAFAQTTLCLIGLCALRRVASLLFVALVGLSGLEPPTSRLSGVRSNQLSYKPLAFYQVTGNGDGEIRTLDPLLARQVLSQLSYTPRFSVHAKGYEQIYIKYFLFLFNPAATCSPTPSPVQYHRPIRS